MASFCRFYNSESYQWAGQQAAPNSLYGGFLGMPASDVRADMQVVDVCRRDGEKLVQNCGIVNLLWWLKQQGLDALERTRQSVAG
jgi:hypothetical protein